MKSLFRQAFLSNLDELLDAAETGGFDFGLLEDIAGIGQH